MYLTALLTCHSGINVTAVEAPSIRERVLFIASEMSVGRRVAITVFTSGLVPGLS